MAVKAPAGLGDPLLGPLRAAHLNPSVDERLSVGKGRAIPETSIGLQGQAGQERPEDGWTRQARVQLQAGGQWETGAGQDWTKQLSRPRRTGSGDVSIDAPARPSAAPEQTEALGKVKEPGLSGWEKSAWAHRAVAAFEESMRFMGGLFTKPFAT